MFGVWQVEAGTPKRAATIEFTRDRSVSYGFSCWKNRWLFFFNYQAPAGGLCEDSEECEGNVSEVSLTFKIPERPDAGDNFTLFENYYFQDENLSVLDIEAMIKAGGFRLELDDSLKAIWQTAGLDFRLDGFEKAVTDAKTVFSCPLREPIPVPIERPSQIAQAKAKPEKIAQAKSRNPQAKKTKAKKSKAARARAAKSKLPSHALKKKAGKEKIRKRRR